MDLFPVFDMVLLYLYYIYILYMASDYFFFYFEGVAVDVSHCYDALVVNNNVRHTINHYVILPRSIKILFVYVGSGYTYTLWTRTI